MIIPFPTRSRPQPPLTDLLPRYELALKSRKRRPRGVALYLKTLRRVFATMSPGSTMADLTIDACRHYQESIGHLSGSSIENTLYALRSFCRWGIDEGLRDDDPTEALHWPRVASVQPQRLKESEIAALLMRVRTIPAATTAAERWRWKRNTRAVFLMLFAGLRLSEAAALRWRDVDLESGAIVVRSEAAKGGDERTVPIHRRLRTALESVPKDERTPEAGVIPVRAGGQPLSYKGLERVMDRWGPVALTVCAHQLRHAFATRMHRKKVPVRTIQVLLGHKDLNTTMRYLGVDPSDTAAAIEELDW